VHASLDRAGALLGAYDYLPFGSGEISPWARIGIGAAMGAIAIAGVALTLFSGGS